MSKPSRTLVVGAVLLAGGGLFFSRAPLAEFLFNQGLRAKKEWRLGKAIQYFDWSQQLTRDAARARFEKGTCHQLRGEFLASQREFDKLMDEPVENVAFRAQLLNARGVNRFNMNEADAAIELHQQSLELARTLGDQRLEARALIDLSRVLYHLKGQSDHALSHLERALQIGRRLRNELVQADAMRNIGILYMWFEGELDRPLEEYHKPALEIYRRHGDPRRTAITLSNIGLIYWNKGDFYQFMRYQNESIELSAHIGDAAGLSDSYLYVGSMYHALKNYRKAHEYYLKSRDLSERVGYQLTQNEVKNRLAKIYMDLGEFDEAIAVLGRLLDQERTHPMLAKYRLSWLAECYWLKGEPERARDSFQRALEIDRRQPDSRFSIGVLTRLGDVHMALDEWQRAAEMLALAHERILMQRERYWAGEVHHHLASAELMEHHGRPDEALVHLLEAAEIESRVFGSSETQFVQGRNRRLYDRLFTLLLDDSEKMKRPAQKPIHRCLKAASLGPREEIAFRILEQLRYRSFSHFVVKLGDKKPDLHSLRQSERDALSRIERMSSRLRTRQNPELRKQLWRAYSDYEDLVLRAQLAESRYQLVRQARPAALEEVQRRLDPETALIEYLVAGDEVYGLAITRSALQSVTLPIRRSTLAAKVKLLRSLIFNQQGPADWQAVAADLRRRLIDPFEQTGVLSGIRRLGLVPFGALHDLPFAALARVEGERVTFLIEEYSLFHTLSATFFTHSDERMRTPDRTMISFGRNQSNGTELPPLRFAEEEAHAVSEIFGGEVRVNARASETELKRLARQFTFIHLATHAVSEPLMPLLSCLHLQSGPEDDGRLTAREILDLGLRAELVTLGACQSGRSFSSSGNKRVEVDRMGLIEAFLHAGAHSVLASLLPVDDRSTLEFMKAFYRNIRSMDKAEALAQTQRAMLHGRLAYQENDRWHRLTHPRYWAAFILVGDDR